MKRLLVGAAAVLLPLGLLAAWAITQYRHFENTPLALGRDGLVLEVHPGDTPRSVVSRLAQQGVTQETWTWRVLHRFQPVTIRAGEYHIESGTTPGSLMQRLADGAVLQHNFTIVEGWTYRQLVEALLASEVLTASPEQLAPEGVMAELGQPDQHPEGWFLPETYAVVRGADALDVLRRANAAMRQALEAAWAGRDLGLPLSTDYEMLTLASIVEKESAVASERPEIAGVFVRRLEQNWRLETDPTVIYGLGESFDGDIRRRDLRTDTPYNTYTRRGLPPTPIAMPSLQSLLAVAAPAPGTAMFFVADGQGGHVFSDTLEAHNRAVQEYLRRTGN